MLCFKHVEAHRKEMEENKRKIFLPVKSENKIYMLGLYFLESKM